MLGVSTWIACAPPKPDPNYGERGESYNNKAKDEPEDTAEPQNDAGAPRSAPATDAGKINKAACNLPSAVAEKSGNITCKAGAGLAPNKVGGKPLEGTYILTQCAYYDGAVEKPSARGTIRVTGDVMEYVDEVGYLGGAFQVEGSTLNVYGDLCAPPGATAATPTLVFGFSVDGNDIVRVRDDPGKAVRVLRFTKQ